MKGLTMRHFEEYEIENLINSTGTFYFRFFCRLHLKRCPLCRKRYERVIEEKHTAQKFKNAILRFINSESAAEGTRPSGDEQ